MQSCDRGNNNQGFVLRQNREWICWLVIRASRYIYVYWYMIQCKYHTIVVCDTTDTKLKRIFAKPTSIKDLSCESGSVQVRAQCWRSSCWLLIACSELFNYKEPDSFFTQQSLKPTMLWTWWDDNWEALMFDTNTQVWPFCWAFERVWQIEFWEVFVLAEWFGVLPNPPLLIRHDSNLQHCPSPTSVLQCIWYWYISKGFLQRLVLLHTTYIFLCLPAQCTWQFYLTQSYLFACFLLVLTLLCRTKHTKGLLRYLYSSN